MEFSGFQQEQFDVFDIPGFAERMAALRTQVRPTLIVLGDVLAPRLSEMVGHPLYPHVATHARRRVNPPDDTWVAFGRAARGYKAIAHFEVGLSSEGMFAGLVLKDEASADRAQLGRRLSTDPADLAALAAALRDYHLHEPGGRSLADLSREELCKLGDGLAHRKTASFHLIRLIPRNDARLSNGPAVADLAYMLLLPLAPLYTWSCSGD